MNQEAPRIPDRSVSTGWSSPALRQTLSGLLLLCLSATPLFAAGRVANPVVGLSKMVRFVLGGAEQHMPYEEIDGWVVVGGDMILGRVDEMEPPRAGGHGIHLVAAEVNGWPGAVIPYVLTDEYLALHSRKKFEAAVKQLHKQTNLRLVERTDQASYIKIRTSWLSGGCMSELGYKGRVQSVNLGKGCGSKSTHMHEILHAFGLPHEHQRHDRDEYIIVHEDRIKPGKEGNFTKMSAKQFLNPYPYDYESIMHYGARAFSKNGQKTMEVRSPPAKQGQQIGLRSGLSKGDLRLIEFRVQSQLFLEGKIDGVSSVPTKVSADADALPSSEFFGTY